MINGAEALVSPGRIHPIYLEGKLLPIQNKTAVDLNLKDGQVVQGLVKLHDDQPALFLKGQLVQVPLPLSVPVGEPLWLKVVNKQANQWSLLPTSPPTGPHETLAASARPHTDSLALASGAWVSRIASLLYKPIGTESLAQLYRPGTLDALLQSVPRQDLQTQWRNLQLSMSQLTPAAIKQAMTNAMGVEVWLGKGLQPQINDPKQLIRKLIDSLSQMASSELSDETTISKLHSAIDDLEASQVQSVQAQAQREVLFSMMIPFVDADPVELTIRRGPPHEGESAGLTVNIHSKTSELGPVWLKTQLLKTQEVELVMWATDSNVVSLAKNRAYLLGQELQTAGLVMRSFQVIHGPRPEAIPEWVPSGRGLVVDIAA